MNYSVVFTGEISPVFSHEQVVANLAMLFKKDSKYIEQLFTGKKVTIKKGLTEQAAKKYQQAMANAGAVTELVSSEQVVETKKPGNPAPTEVPEDDMSVAQAGELIMQHKAVDEPEIDTSQLSMSAAGEIIKEAELPDPAQIDSSHLDLSPAGSKLVEAKQVEPLEVDISSLSMDDPGSDILSDK